MTSVVVLDYGSGNVRSAQRALERVGAGVTVTADPAAVADADGLVVPGVGAFAACMEGLRTADAPRLIGRRLAGGRPVLGICVGMQVLFETGVEHGVVTQGLGEWPGTVERLTADVLPHMGWNTVDASPDSVMLAGLDDAYFYFVHSYAARPRDPSVIAGVTDYGGEFCAAVARGRLFATQFHPEKSQETGMRLLRAFVDRS